MRVPFDIFTTGDGSPTLVFERADGYVEKMHHSHGALSESLYIYREPLLDVLARGWPARVVSVGLGLGYNEMIAAAEFMKAGLSDWKIWSFEALHELRDGFRACLSGNSNETNLAPTFDQVLTLVAEKTEVERARLQEQLREALADGRLELRGPFPDDTGDLTGATCIFYDAYSNKMDPHLWEEDSLARALASISSRTSVFTTYAATGALNRTLKGLGFKLQKRRGFSGKRESTWAVRE